MNTKMTSIKDGVINVAVTGHRPSRLKGAEPAVSAWLSQQLQELNKEHGIFKAYCGMAQGTDQLFALECIKQDIPLYCVYPFEREKYHPQEEYIMDSAAAVIFLQSEDSHASYFKRDKYMVDHCDVLLAVWDGNKNGGTWLTIKYAQDNNIPIIFYEGLEHDKDKENSKDPISAT